jgi:prepilin-type N-terminal cleavage/methylation domain-containing protein
MNRKGVPEGFSLVELIIVIALIAIVMSISIPTWHKYRNNSELKSAAREVMADISDSKQRAVTENSDDYKLEFNVSGNSYALTKSGVTQWTKSLASSGNGIALSSVSFSGTDISLNRRGTVTNGNLVIRNGLAPPSTATIKVNITGRTYVVFDIK